jgi:hypothetical protein
MNKMSHLHELLAEVEEPVTYRIVDPNGVVSIRYLYLEEVDALIDAGYTVKEAS